MSIKTIITFLAITMGVLLGVGGLLWQFGQNGVSKPIPNIEGEKRYTQGNGKIIVTEFSDFQCPACAQTQPKLKEILGRSGEKITFVYRHFPLTSIHKNAMIAAQAAEAAHLQGKFWEMHDTLFEKQKEWAGLADPKSKFGEYIEALGLDKEKFEKDMVSEEVKQVVMKDLTAANQYRLAGTPSFFVNGVEVDVEQIEARIKELE